MQDINHWSCSETLQGEIFASFVTLSKITYLTCTTVRGAWLKVYLNLLHTNRKPSKFAKDPTSGSCPIKRCLFVIATYALFYECGQKYDYKDIQDFRCLDLIPELCINLQISHNQVIISSGEKKALQKILQISICESLFLKEVQTCPEWLLMTISMHGSHLSYTELSP